MTSIIENMKPVLQNVLKLQTVDNVNPETRLFEDLNMDSTSSLELLMALEEVIDGLVIDPETLDVEHFKTVGNLATYIKETLEKNGVTVH